MARSAATGRKKKATKTPQKEAEAPADDSMTSQDGEDVQEEGDTGAVGGEEMMTDETAVAEGGEAPEDEGAGDGEEDEDDEDGEGGGGFVVDAGDDEDDDGEDDADVRENKQIKRKMEQAIARKAKRYKVEEPMRVNVYMSRTSREVDFNERFKSFLSEKEIEAVDVTKNDHKIWDLFAVLEFQKEEDKAKLMSLSGTTLGDRSVKFEDIKENNIDGLKAPPEEVLFVGNLPKTTTKLDLQELFPPAKEVFFPMSKHGEKRGFAFLVMESTAVVEEQIEAHKGLTIEGFELVISKYTPKKKTGLNPVPGKKVLFIGNMNYNTTKETLREFFDDCETARILVNPQTKRSKGVGFLEFRTHKDAKKALKTHNGAVIDDREIFLEYADHEPKPQSQERFSRGGSRGNRGRGNFGGGYGKNQSNYGGYGPSGHWSPNFGNRGNYGGDGYGYGGQLGGYGGGYGGGMGGGYKNFGGRGGGGGGYNQRFQRGGNFKSNRGNRGRY